LPGQDEGKVIREALRVSLHLLVETADGHAVQGGQIRIENDPAATQDENRAFNTLHWNQAFSRHFAMMPSPRVVYKNRPSDESNLAPRRRA
jgi:hypothetical protein